METRLFRSRQDAMVGGVCGGLGEYLGIDSTFVRLFFVLLAFNGIGVLIYILLWIVMPLEGQPKNADLRETVRQGSQEIAERTLSMGQDLRGIVRQPHPQAGLIIGLALIILGAFYLVDSLHLPWLRWLDFDVLWPVLLIVGGLALLFRRSKRGG